MDQLIHFCVFENLVFQYMPMCSAEQGANTQWKLSNNFYSLKTFASLLL